MDKMLYLIRGLPGAGKSTFARQLASTFCAEHVEADMFFMLRGQYVFDVRELHNAHKWCQERSEFLMDLGRPVVVSNTFTTEKELKPYLALAEKYGYRVTSLIVENRHGNQSVHNVPEETLVKMKNRFSVKL